MVLIMYSLSEQGKTVRLHPEGQNMACQASVEVAQQITQKVGKEYREVIVV